MNKVKFYLASDPGNVYLITVTQNKNLILYGPRNKRRPTVAEVNRFLLPRGFIRTSVS